MAKYTVQELKAICKELDLVGYSQLNREKLCLAIHARRSASRGMESELYRPRRRTHRKEEAYYYEDPLQVLVSQPLPPEVGEVTWKRKVAEIDKSDVDPSQKVDTEFHALAQRALSL